MPSTVKFIVGKEDNKKSYTIDREALIRRSTFFMVKFRRPNADTVEEINLPEDDPEAFDVFARYIETGEIQSQCTKEVINSFPLFERYWMADVLTKCEDYLSDFITSDTAAEILEITHRNLRTFRRCWLQIFANTEEVLKSTGFLNLRTSMVLDIIIQDTMSRWLDDGRTEMDAVREITVYKSVIEWAKKESVRNARNGKETNLRKILEPLLPHIRFLLMTNEEFEEVVCKDGILTEKEQTEVSKAIEVGATESELPFLNLSKEVRKPFDSKTCFVPCCGNSEEYSSGYLMTLHFRPKSHNIVLYGIILHDQHPRKNNYVVTVKNITKRITKREKISQEADSDSPHLLLTSSGLFIKQHELCTVTLQTQDPITCCLRECETHPLLEKLPDEGLHNLMGNAHFQGILAIKTVRPTMGI